MTPKDLRFLETLDPMSPSQRKREFYLLDTRAGGIGVANSRAKQLKMICNPSPSRYRNKWGPKFGHIDYCLNRFGPRDKSNVALCAALGKTVRVMLVHNNREFDLQLYTVAEVLQAHVHLVKVKTPLSPPRVGEPSVAKRMRSGNEQAWLAYLTDDRELQKKLGLNFICRIPQKIIDIVYEGKMCTVPYDKDYCVDFFIPSLDLLIETKNEFAINDEMLRRGRAAARFFNKPFVLINGNPNFVKHFVVINNTGAVVNGGSALHAELKTKLGVYF